MDNQIVRISGAGQYNAANLESKNSEILVSGFGQAFVNVSNSLNVNVSGAATVKYKGDPKTINQNISGGGKVIKIN